MNETVHIRPLRQSPAKKPVCNRRPVIRGNRSKRSVISNQCRLRSLEFETHGRERSSLSQSMTEIGLITDY